MSESIIVPRQRAAGLGRRRPATDLRLAGWVCVGAGTALAGLGLLSNERYLVAGGAGMTVAVAGLLMPQIALALLVTIGGFKAAPWLKPLPGDPTVLAALWVVGIMLVRSIRSRVPPWPPATVLAFLLGALVLLSVLWSPVPQEGLTKALRFEILTLLAFVAPLVIVTSRRDFSYLMTGLVGFGLLIALTAQKTGNPLKPLTVIGGNDTNEIDLALYCAVGTLAATYALLRGSRVMRLLAGAAGPVLLYVLFAAGSRGILVGALLAIVYIVIALTGPVIRPRTAVIGLACAALLVPLAIAASPDAAARYQKALFSGQADTILGQRGYLFKTGWQLAVGNPVGIGSAGYPYVTGLVYPHNIELELADEHGLLAVGLFGALVWTAWRARRRGLRLGANVESVVVGAIIVVLFFDAQVSHGLNESRPLWLAFGLAFALPALAASEASRGREGQPP